MSELERELLGFAASLEFPPTPDLSSRVRAGLAPRPSAKPVWPRRIALVAVAVVLAAGAALAVPQARSAILHFFGIGAVRIEFVDRLPEVPLPAPHELGTEIAPSDAPYPLVRSKRLGEPDAVYLRHGVVTLLYGSPARARLLVTEIQSPPFDPAVVKKLASGGTRVEFVMLGGQPDAAIWIEGLPHAVRLPGGPTRLAGNTLIWQRGALTLRLEGAESLRQAIQIAESLR